jgi:hypothetical protein
MQLDNELSSELESQDSEACGVAYKSGREITQAAERTRTRSAKALEVEPNKTIAQP